MNGTDIHSCAHITYDVKLAQGWAHKTLTELYEEDVFPWDGGPYLYNAGPHAHGARGEEGRVRGEGHISSTAGYFRGARLGHL